MSSRKAVLQWRDLPPAPPRKKESGRGAQNRAPNGYGEGAFGAFSDHEQAKIGGPLEPFFGRVRRAHAAGPRTPKIAREIQGSGAESGGPGPSQAPSRRLGANNPTPGLRKTRPRPAVSGLALSGPPPSVGKRAKAPLKLFEINYGMQTRNARPGVRGDARGDPQNPYLSGFGRRLTPCLPCHECSNGEIYLLRRRGRKNQAGGLRIRLRMAMARAHLAPFLTTSTRK